MIRSTGLMGISLAAAVCLALACSSSSSSSTGGRATDAGQEAAATTKNLIGDPCPNGAGDCADGLFCASEDPGGGQCSKECSPSVDTDCGDTTKYACSFEGHCYLRCTEQSDCKRTGYACKR